MQARKTEEALERAKLLETLQLRQQEVYASKIRFRKLADAMPIGVFMSTKDRLSLYSNQCMHDMFATDANAPPAVILSGDVFADEDKPAVESFWQKLITGTSTATLEVRMRKPASRLIHHHDNGSEFRWVLVTCIPEICDGSLKHVTGCITDVSSIKQAEELQRQRVKDVTKSQKQQEAFIDMTR